MKRSGSITVCEIFGPTIQGEGALIGLPTVFVRTGGCDYHCAWCDTLYAVERPPGNGWQEMTAGEIIDRVTELADGKPLLVSLSGGNPALQPLAALITLGRARGYSFAMETQGSIVKPWFSSLDYLVLSPKPPSSGMKTDFDKLQECVVAAGAATVSLKFVIKDEDDYLFARRIAAHLPQLPVYLQPCHVNEAGSGDGEAMERMHWLVARVLDDAWYQVRVLPQLHVLLWGSQRGR